MSTTGGILEQARQRKRYPLCKGQTIKVAIRRTAGLSPERVDARLTDLSLEGMRLSVPARLAAAETIILSFEIPELNLQVSRTARVCWGQPSDAASWQFGCVFDKELPQEIIDELAIHGYLQRRKDPRHPISAQCRVRWQMTGENVLAQIVDYSPGGICIFSSHAGRIGESLLIELDDENGMPAPVFTRAMWQNKAEDGYFIGCMFLSKDGYQLIQGLLERLAASKCNRTHSSQWQSALRTALLVVLLLLCFATYVLLR